MYCRTMLSASDACGIHIWLSLVLLRYPMHDDEPLGRFLPFLFEQRASSDHIQYHLRTDSKGDKFLAIFTNVFNSASMLFTKSLSS
jgi:hypothetical protein